MKLVLTDDGSHTLMVPELNEHYHSTFGAVTESMHVFIRTGLESLPPGERVSVFEIGFGTGLNALLTCMVAMQKNMNVVYYALEKYPVDSATVAMLNYPEVITAITDARTLFNSLHSAPWNSDSIINKNFRIQKLHSDLTRFVPWFYYDLIYFDAFAPDKQPEMWTRDIFTALYDHLNPGGILTTYCVKGDVKRILKQAGFQIEKLPGPPGKREILRGWKKSRK